MNADDAVGNSPDEFNSRVSRERIALPLPASSAPPVVSELSHPCCGKPVLPHGQAAPDPSPKQKGVMWKVGSINTMVRYSPASIPVYSNPTGAAGVTPSPNRF
jgi:hypothetical protein